MNGLSLPRQLLALLAGLLLSLPLLAESRQYELGVDGLACPFCAYGIEKKLRVIDGVAQVRVDIANSLVRVTMREGATLSEARARRAVEQAGFTLRSFREAGGG
ncbi:heavy-metal-associated domain-containing protein [Microbulbifer magnicolonia]|uniref:heavy-metal-associated domain-containing protein n=1 Tax=Microbulbifer magnicolonia TaxID=3109744 RepID=UPI002B403468|nr:heavy-metal-associated domain-containing protein [Microbulbifer sp. GG15]